MTKLRMSESYYTITLGYVSFRQAYTSMKVRKEVRTRWNEETQGKLRLLMNRRFRTKEQAELHKLQLADHECFQYLEVCETAHF